MLRWLATNVRLFLLAFALAVVVWVTAVTAANPDVTQDYPAPIPIEFIGQDPGLVMTGSVPETVQVTLRAPKSVWDAMISGESSIRAVVDLTGLKAGSQSVAVQLQVGTRPVRIISVTPQKFDLALENLVTRTLSRPRQSSRGPNLWLPGWRMCSPAWISPMPAKASRPLSACAPWTRTTWMCLA
jgi:YbbR domain-containing protein